jgi:hypothetical protein
VRDGDLKVAPAAVMPVACLSRPLLKRGSHSTRKRVVPHTHLARLITAWGPAAGMKSWTSNVMAPATGSVMSSIPESKAGAGSAMNDVNRQVGGALGVAIIGSIMNSAYRSRISATVADLPGGVRHAARDSIGSAYAVAQHLPAAAAHHLDTAAASAFTHALGIGFFSAAIAATAAAPVVISLLPGGKTRRADSRARAAAAAAAQA